MYCRVCTRVWQLAALLRVSLQVTDACVAPNDIHVWVAGGNFCWKPRFLPDTVGQGSSDVGCKGTVLMLVGAILGSWACRAFKVLPAKHRHAGEGTHRSVSRDATLGA
jgi:hypothetical protein